MLAGSMPQISLFWSVFVEGAEGLRGRVQVLLDTVDDLIVSPFVLNGAVALDVGLLMRVTGLDMNE